MGQVAHTREALLVQIGSGVVGFVHLPSSSDDAAAYSHALSRTDECLGTRTSSHPTRTRTHTHRINYIASWHLRSSRRSCMRTRGRKHRLVDQRPSTHWEPHT